MADEQDGEKTEDPSQHRIDESRKRGEVASSKELASVVMLAACVMTLSIFSVYIYETLADYIKWLYTIKIEDAFTPVVGKTIISHTALTALKSLAPIFGISFVMGIVVNVAQIGFLFSPEVLQLKFSRVNPISGVKKLFSMRSIVEALKGVFKFSIIISIVYFYIKDDINSYGGFLHMDFFSSFEFAKDMVVKIVMAMLSGLLVVAAGDFAYQKYSHFQKLKMTKEEAKQEHKQQEGSPEVRQKIRQIQREMSQKRMMTDIPTADVIVTNPTHISIALKYDPETMISPEVIGKGADHLAMKIRELAKDNNIPIVENVPLARTLYKTVKVNEAVPRTLYKMVAEILAFVYKLKRKEKALN